jgi:hypothetical protein
MYSNYYVQRGGVGQITTHYDNYRTKSEASEAAYPNVLVMKTGDDSQKVSVKDVLAMIAILLGDCACFLVKTIQK